MIEVSSLTAKDISFLADPKALYTCDFRAISESMDYEIPAMWKYENFLANVIQAGSVALNENAQAQEKNYEVVVVPTVSDPRVSVYRRLESHSNLRLEKLWVAIPHPDADALAQKLGCSLNYSYKNFIPKNDKFEQKRLFGDMSPRWDIVKGRDELQRLQKESRECFIKRRFGSGGYTVFPIQKTVNNESFDRLMDDSSNEWFVEDKIIGTSCSIQCVRFADLDKIVIFGFSEQKIVDESIFAGSIIKPLVEMQPIQDQLMALLKRLEPMLMDYEGFFGIDFLIQADGKVQTLEANIRLTAATVPTLVFNKLGGKSAEYYEDLPNKEVQEGDVVLMQDAQMNTADILRIHQ